MMQEFLDIEVVKIILDDAEWIHPHYKDWVQESPQLFKCMYRNGKGENLTVVFNSYELNELLKDCGGMTDQSKEIISDMVAYQMIGDFWIPSSPKQLNDSDDVFSSTIEGKVVTQFFANVPTGLIEWSVA